MYSCMISPKFKNIFHIELYDESEEDEWTALEKRLVQEGLNRDSPLEGKLLHVWRWLVDAESNLKTTRKMLDKLQAKHNQEMEEVEYFVEKLKDVTDQRVAKVEEERQQVLNRLQNVTDMTAESILTEISEMLKREGLDEIAVSPISEQIAYLLVERSKLMEEISLERRKRRGVTANLTDNVKLSSTQIQQLLDEQKADYEEELKFQQNLAKEIKEQMKKYHEDEMRQIQQNLRQTQIKVEELNNDTSNGDIKAILQKKCKELEERVTEMNDRLKVMKKAMRELENENENLIYKLSEAMAECDEQETLLRKMRMNSVLENNSTQRSPSIDGITPVGSPSNETLEKAHEVISESPDPKLQQKSGESEEIETLQDTVRQLEEQLLTMSEKYEHVIMKYQQQRLNQKSKLQKTRDKYQRLSTSLREQVKKLERELSLANIALNKEKIHRNKVLDSLQSLQKENKTLHEKALEHEEIMSEKTRELSLLSIKTRHLEEKNNSLLQQLSLVSKRNSLPPLTFENPSRKRGEKNFAEGISDISSNFSTPLQESTRILEKLSSVLFVVQSSMDAPETLTFDTINKSKEVSSPIDSGIENSSLHTDQEKMIPAQNDHLPYFIPCKSMQPYQTETAFVCTTLSGSHKLNRIRRHSHNDFHYYENFTSSPLSPYACRTLPSTWPSSAISSPNKESVPTQTKFAETLEEKVETSVDVS